jgi:hypothetical protein
MLEVDITKDGQVNSAGNKDMKRQFRLELDSVLSGNSTMEDFMADWGMTEDEVFNNEWLTYPQEEELNRLQGGEEEIVSEWEPDYSKTAEYEGTGITSELIPGEGLVAPILAGMGVDPTTAAVIGSVATKKPGMLTNKLFANIKGKKLKANQKANRGVEGPVVTGSSRTLKDSNLRPSITDKTASRYKSMSDRVKKQNATAVGFTGLGAGLVANRLLQDDTPKIQSRNLKGNRDTDGSLIDLNKIARGDDEVGVDEDLNPEYQDPNEGLSNDEYDYYGNRRAVTKIMNDPDGFLQRQMRKKSTTGTTQRFTQDDTGRIVVDDEIGFEEPTGPDMVEAEERPGWKKNPGANWWSVNSKSDYWQTDDGAEEAFELYGEYPSWVKQPEVQELDWSSWFK